MMPQQYHIKFLNRTLLLSNRSILLLIIALAILLRLASAIYQGNTVTDLPGVYDQISYDGLARRVVDGYGFSFAEGHWPATRAGEPTAHWSYLYTLYLALIYKVFGTYPLIARVVQAIIAGIFQTILIWRIGTRLFDQTVGLIAAAINAVYIYFFYYAGALITETFYITCILWVFDTSFRLIRNDSKGPGRAQWLELGFAIGFTVLLRQVFLLFLPFLFIWIWWNVRDLETGHWERRIHLIALKGLTVATVVLTLLILPFTVRNYRAFGTLVLLNTNAGFAFFWGNHPIHGTDFMPLLASGSEGYYDLIPRELLLLSEADLDKALLKMGFQYVLDDPGRFILLSISRVEEFIKFWPSPNSSLFSNISRVGSFGVLIPFIIYGLWLEVTRVWKAQTVIQRWLVILVFSFVVVYTTVHLFSWTLIRYRLPVDAVLIIFAAFGIGTLMEKIIFQRESVKHV